MAKNYAEMSTEELQKLAEDQKNRRAAIRELAQSGADPSILSSLGSADRQTFLMEREQKRVDDWHAANDKARATRMKGILGEEGGRYSPVTIANARKYLEENGYGQEGELRRQFDVTNETTRKVSENEMNGKINYGKGAAEVKAGADITMNKNEWETRAKIAEQEAAAKKYLADQDAATLKYGIDAEHGKIGEDGKVTPGSRERTATIGAEANARQAELQRQHELEKQKIISAGNVEAAKVAGEARVGAAEARSEQAVAARKRRFDEMALSGKFTMAGILPDKWKKMSEEDREKIRNQFFGQMDELNGTGDAPVKKGMSDYEIK